MFNNIGKKIKILAIILCVVGITLSVLVGILFILFSLGLIKDFVLFPSINKTVKIVMGVISIIGGLVGSLVASFVLYGFGQLVENSDRLVAQTRKDVVYYQPPTNNYYY